MDLELSLLGPEGSNKENVVPIAKVTILGVSSQPVDDIEGDRKSKQGMIILVMLDIRHG
jgi:hypothetical protein